MFLTCYILGLKFTFSRFDFWFLISEGYCSRVLDFFPVNNIVHRTPRDTVVHNDFKFLSVSCAFVLEVTIMPWMAIVLGSNLKYYGSKNLQPIICLPIFFWLSCHI